MLRIKQNVASAYHPQTDGQSEKTNQHMETALRIFGNFRQDDWSKLLPIVQYQLNSRFSVSTKQIPYETWMGFVPRAHQPVRDSRAPALSERRLLLRDAWRSATDAITHAQSLWRRPTKFRPYQKGEKVWLEGTNLHTSHPTHKLRPKHFGPIKVTEVLSPVTYQLALPPAWKLHNAFHAALLSPYRETAAHGANYPAPAPELVEGEPEWEIDKILTSWKYGRKRKLQYLIKWVGYPESGNTWEATENLRAPELRREFHFRHPEAAKHIKLNSFTRARGRAAELPHSSHLTDSPTPWGQTLLTPVTSISSTPKTMRWRVRCRRDPSPPSTTTRRRPNCRHTPCKRNTTTPIASHPSPEKETKAFGRRTTKKYRTHPARPQCEQTKLDRIQVRPGSNGMRKAVTWATELSTKGESSSARTFGTGFTKACRTRWEQRALSPINSQGSCMPTLDPQWTLRTPMNATSIYSPKMFHSILPPNKRWTSWTTQECWLRSADSAHSAPTSQCTWSLHKTCKNSPVQCTNSIKALMIKLGKWSSTLKRRREEWSRPGCGLACKTHSSSLHTRGSSAEGFTGPGCQEWSSTPIDTIFLRCSEPAQLPFRGLKGRVALATTGSSDAAPSQL